MGETQFFEGADASFDEEMASGGSGRCPATPPGGPPDPASPSTPCACIKLLLGGQDAAANLAVFWKQDLTIIVGIHIYYVSLFMFIFVSISVCICDSLPFWDNMVIIGF